MVGPYPTRTNDWLLRKLKVDADEAIEEVKVVVVASEVGAEAENVQVVRGVICVITVTRTVIMLRIVQNRQRRENLDNQTVDALFVTKKDIRKSIVQIDEEEEVVENTEEVGVEVYQLGEEEADQKAALALGLGEIDLEDKGKSKSYIILFF
jgi:hypothetical protein